MSKDRFQERTSYYKEQLTIIRGLLQNPDSTKNQYGSERNNGYTNKDIANMLLSSLEEFSSTFSSLVPWDTYGWTEEQKKIEKKIEKIVTQYQVSPTDSMTQRITSVEGNLNKLIEYKNNKDQYIQGVQQQQQVAKAGISYAQLDGNKYNIISEFTRLLEPSSILNKHFPLGKYSYIDPKSRMEKLHNVSNIILNDPSMLQYVAKEDYRFLNLIQEVNKETNIKMGVVESIKNWFIDENEEPTESILTAVNDIKDTVKDFENSYKTDPTKSFGAGSGIRLSHTAASNISNDKQKIQSATSNSGNWFSNMFSNVFSGIADVITSISQAISNVHNSATR